jgi:hypothetical protein
LPTQPGPSHDGGVIRIGPDDNVYVVVGDLNYIKNQSAYTLAQNAVGGRFPDGRGGILRVTQDGEVVEGEGEGEGEAEELVFSQPAVAFVVSSARLKSITVSIPSPHLKVSLPGPPVSLSSPGPPINTSLPSSPNIYRFLDYLEFCLRPLHHA